MEGFEDSVKADPKLTFFNVRVDSFRSNSWPHQDDHPCNPEKMADAGFYMVVGGEEEDLARCYYCQRELDGWEEDDDPWQQHKRRPCPFIKKGKFARNLSVKDAIELEAERIKLLAKKRAEAVAEAYANQAKTIRREIEKLGQRSTNRGRGRGRGKKH